MPNLSRRLLMAAAAATLVALGACSGASSAGSANGDMTMGDPNAPVKLTEYASLSCVHCATFNNEVFPELKSKYIDTGKVHYTLKEFLTQPVEVAAAGFLLARCAGDDKYFSVVDSIFHSQQEMFTSGDVRGTLLRIAQSAGLNEQQFQACVSDEEGLRALNARIDQSQREARITSTPTFLINGKVVKEGEMSIQELDAAIAAAQK
ncbi:DsbA family protein [Phenylobacterium sp.]|uniref:DsbA family protein n=1 Tax=Phenylobacterium sp. TaxID=1871053 RepID=UPI00272EF354|nr:DsbA family protein [Phenylobacterium sp.]MDP1617673.1 DsbA family protein [Phenylobacterium sp.]MDP1985892.1 DsbA family protein [Phenylobacterium sp.]